jgi:hypothetical protein
MQFIPTETAPIPPSASRSFTGIPPGIATVVVCGCCEELVVQPALKVLLAGNFGQLRDSRQRLLALVPETDLTVRRLLAGKTTLVHQVVMVPAEQNKVVQASFATIGPVPDVVTVDKASVGTTRKAATAVPDT